MTMTHVSRGDLRKAEVWLTDKAFRKASADVQRTAGVQKGLRTEIRAGTEDKLGDPLPFIMSLGAVDRYDSTIAVDGWDLGNFVLNPVMPFCHNTYAPTIGRWDNVRVEDDALHGDAVFAIDANPLALMTEKLYRGRFMFACSVGFIPLEWEIANDRDDGESWFPPLDYIMQELTECSPCPVPGQPGALVQGQRSMSASFQAARAAGIDVAPYVAFLERHLDELRGPDDRQPVEQVWKELRDAKIINLPPPAASNKEQPVSERRILVVRLEANVEHIEKLKSELDKKARNIGAKVLAMRDDGDNDADDQGGAHAKAMGEHVKAMGEHVKAFAGHSEAYAANNEKLGVICKDLGALKPDKDPENKAAPGDQARGGASHKLSSANNKDVTAAHEAISRVLDRHAGPQDDPEEDDGDEEKKAAKEAEKRAKAEKDAAAKELAAKEAEAKARTEALEKQVLKMQESLDKLVTAATGKVK